MKRIIIGRSSKSDYVINDGTVSSSHALITVLDSGEVYIEDLSSKNGTLVNGVKIKSKTILTSGATVLLGNHSIDWKSIIQTAKQKTTLAKPEVTYPSSIIDKKLIGRNALSQIRFSYDDVSDKHAYLCKQTDGSVLLIDNNSTNGTYVNGIRISSPRVLKKGDSILLSNRHPLNWEAVYPPKTSIILKSCIAIAASIIVIIGIFLLKPWSWTEKDWSRIYAEHKNDVVLVYVKSAYVTTVQGRLLSSYLNGNDQLDYLRLDSDGDVVSGIVRSSGTGFFISSDGKLLTNRHVVGSDNEEAKNIEKIKRTIQLVLRQNGLSQLAANVEVNYVVISVGIIQNDTYIDSENDLIPCTVLKTSEDPELDVAILQTNSKTLPNGSAYIDLTKSVPSNKLALGHKICTIGFPQSFTIGQTSVGLEANNQSGEITQVRGHYEYGHNITIHQGASGSPVYDKKGRFAGIIVSGFLGISQGYNQAIQPTPVIEFVDKYIQ
mgnify:FL=1